MPIRFMDTWLQGAIRVMTQFRFRFVDSSFIVKICLFALSSVSTASAQTQTQVRLAKHVPTLAMAKATLLGRVAASSPIALVVPMKLRNEAGLDSLIQHQSMSGDPLYGKFLTPAEFADAFGPTQADYDMVKAELASQGLSVTTVHENRLLIGVQGTAAQVENAFSLQLQQYQTADGRVVRAPNADPMVSSKIAPLIEGITGLSGFAKPRHHAVRRSSNVTGKSNFGSGPNSTGLLPVDIRKAYGLSSSMTGTGQSIALYEFDGYTTSDITSYKTQAAISGGPTLQNILIDGFNGVASVASKSDPSPGSLEVTLDIEMALALMPGGTKILVYEGASSAATEAGFETQALDIWSRIATDNLASVVSTSWGFSAADDQIAASTLNSENNLLKEMAAQGQSVFAAAGDSGAYISGTNTIGMTDPGDQPYITSVGGTSLSITSAGAYSAETSWVVAGSAGSSAEGGSGGISTFWPIPSYQAGLGTTANLGSSTMRMSPDVSLDADPNTGYSIYFEGAFYEIGGTSAAAPLWACFIALVNQQRTTNGLGNLGFINTPIYQIATSSIYGNVFHDIADGSNNLKYPAVTGYDLTTGWGSFQTALLSMLGTGQLPPGAPTNLTVTLITP